MRILLFALLCIASSNVSAQVFTSARFGGIKLKMPVDSINTILDKKISLPKITNEDDYRYDTVLVNYKSIEVRLVFTQYYDYDTKKFKSELVSIYSASSTVSTRSGIKPGDNKFDVIKKLDGGILTVRPEKEMGKNISTVSLYDQENFNDIVFYFKGNVLYAIECRMGVEDEC